jgi:predicted amino acid dehydrogenase
MEESDHFYISSANQINDEKVVKLENEEQEENITVFSVTEDDVKIEPEEIKNVEVII